MSTRTYPVIDYGLTLTFEELSNLIKTYYGDNEDIKEEIKNNKEEYLDRDFIDDLMYGDFSNFCMIGNFEGEFSNFEENNSKDFGDYGDETLYYIPLMKADVTKREILFQKYENMDEVYNEIKEVLEDLKVKFDMDFIKKNTGKIEGTYCG